ncbi:MAG: hypothetical protein N4A47_03985 [Clostridia bacterium]|jgi:predicted transcriptional regulator|nr:hypothetical protein [Clostridia bacterium]
MEKKKILMSINTKYSRKIFKGTKLWEFRKAIPRIEETDELEVVVYSSQEEKAIVGSFKAGQILRCSLDELMEKTGYSDDSDAVEWFSAYYGDRKICSAIEVIEPIEYEKPITLNEIREVIPSFRPPQNFVYITSESNLEEVLEPFEVGEVGE